MSKFKKHSIVLIPTREETNLILFGGNNDHLIKSKDFIKRNFGGHHLYILSDEKIKEGDSFINLMNSNIRNKAIRWDINTLESQSPTFKSHCKKIIATTDKSLRLKEHNSFLSCCQSKENCHCYLPQISESLVDNFIQRFNDGKAINKVMVEYVLPCTESDGGKHIIIQYPEEIYSEYDKYVNGDGELTINQWCYKFDHLVLKVDGENFVNAKEEKVSWNKKEIKDIMIEAAKQNLFEGGWKSDVSIKIIEDFLNNQNI
jgi:hypothetical protein